MQALTYIGAMITLLFSLSVQAIPMTYDFTQGGYFGGASMTGQFIGEDLDQNGQLSSFAGEISGFQLSFDGGGFVASFELGLQDLFGLVYDLDGGVLGDGIDQHIEGLLAFGQDALLAAGPGPLWNVCDQGVICSVALSGYQALFSKESIVVSEHTVAVPEPGSMGLILIGVVGLFMARRRMINGSRNSETYMAK